MFEIKNNEKKYTTGKLDEKGRLRCPMCKGRGYFRPTEQGENDSDDCYFSLEEIKEKDTSFKLPALDNKKCRNLPDKQKEKVTHFPSVRRTKDNGPCKNPVDLVDAGKWDFSYASNDMGKKDHEEQEDHSNIGFKKNFSSSITANSNSNENEADASFMLPSPKTPKNPQDLLKVSLIKLKGNDWNESLTALADIIQISRYHPDLLEGSMVTINRGITSLLKSFRSKITRTACQAVSELFSNVPNNQRPEFDELVSALLQKTADTNKFVRRDANEALDSMVINILPLHSVRTLVQKGIPNRNSTVRAAAARLLVCIVGLVGVRTIFSGNKETRNRIISAGAQCLQDGCQEVRSYACRLMKMLIEHEDFDEILQGCVSNVLINRIEKSLITIKYSKSKSSIHS